MHIAYIDRQNLRITFQKKGYFLVPKRFFIYLKEKFKIDRAIIYTGYREDKKEEYISLQSAGFEMVYRDVIEKKGGVYKANIDSNLIVDALEHYIDGKLSKAFLISNDGDFDVLVDFWKKKDIFGLLFFPDARYASQILRKQVGDHYYDLFSYKERFSDKQKESIATL